MNPKKAKPAAGARTARVRVAAPKKGSAKKQAAGRTRSVGKLKTRRHGDGETGRKKKEPFELVMAAAKRKAGRLTNKTKPLSSTEENGGNGEQKNQPKEKKAKPSEMLPDGQQEYFCLKMAEGPYSQKSAYMQAYPDSAPDSARANASRLMTNDSIRGRIEFLRAELIKDVKTTVEESIRWCLLVRDTPVGYVDEESPLAQEVIRKEMQMGGPQGQLKRGNEDSGNENDSPPSTIIETKIKIPSKMDAQKQIDKLMGFEKPQEINLNLPYEPPSKAMERLVGKGVNLPEILKKAGLMR